MLGVEAVDLGVGHHDRRLAGIEAVLLIARHRLLADRHYLRVAVVAGGARRRHQGALADHHLEQRPAQLDGGVLSGQPAAAPGHLGGESLHRDRLAVDDCQGCDGPRRRLLRAGAMGQGE